MFNFEHEISELKRRLLAMAGLSIDAVQRAIRATLERDPGLASTGREVDKDIDELEIEIDEMAMNLLPRARTPEELRLIAVVMKIARDLERVGDEATTISRRACSSSGEAGPPVNLSHRASMVVGMLNDALKAFVDGDTARARAIIPRDKEVDALNRRLHEDLTAEMVRSPAAIPRCLDLMVISKSLERIGDHAKNVAEDVVYLYEGRDIRHIGKGKVRPAEPPH